MVEPVTNLSNLGRNRDSRIRRKSRSSGGRQQQSRGGPETWSPHDAAPPTLPAWDRLTGRLAAPAPTSDFRYL
jgi:hypothetical protein